MFRNDNVTPLPHSSRNLLERMLHDCNTNITKQLCNDLNFV